MKNVFVCRALSRALLAVLSCVLVLPAAAASTIDTRVIDDNVQAKSDAISVCYEEGLARKPKLSGKIVVLFLVENDGTVSKVEVTKKGTTLKDEIVTTCVLAEFEKLTFPVREDGCDASKENCTVKVTYPLTFTP